MKEKNKAIFLDRDGTIIKDYGYMFDCNKINFLPKAIEGLKRFEKNGYLLIIITNQSGVGRKIFTKKQAMNFHKCFLNELSKNNINIRKTYFCFHRPEDNCKCRKPKQKLLYKAMRKFNIDLSKSIVIGDKESDILLAKNTKMKSVLVSNKKKNIGSTFIVKNLLDIQIDRNKKEQDKFLP